MRLLNRTTRNSTLAATSRLRPEACPPSLRCEPDTAWQRWMFWLMAPAPEDSAPPVNRLPLVRLDFLDTLVDMHAADADDLRSRIREAHSLRDLWHARAEVFRVVGVARGQSEAERRIGLLDRHFQPRNARLHGMAL